MRLLSSLKSDLKNLVDRLKAEPTNKQSIIDQVSERYGIDITESQIPNIADDVAINVVGDLAVLLTVDFVYQSGSITHAKTINITDYPLSIIDGVTTYHANDLFVSISGFTNSETVTSRGIQLQLSANTSVLYEQMFNYGYMNAKVSVKIAYVDKLCNSIGSVPIFKGSIDSVSLDTTRNNGMVFSFKINSIYGRLDKTSGKRPANSVQRLIDPNDKGFEWTARTKAEEKWRAK